MAHREHIAGLTNASAAIADVRVSSLLNSLILGLSLVLLPGAVWKHAT